MRLLRRLVLRPAFMPWLLVAAVTLPACSAAPPPPVDAASLLRDLQTEIGTAACTQHSQCRTVPIGHKACGGPDAYLAWSTTGGRESRILALAKAHADASQAANQKSGRVSDCAMVMDPGAMCGPQQRCILTPRPNVRAVM